MKIIRPVKDWYLTQEFWENPKYYGKFNMSWHNGIDYGTHRKPWPVVAVFDWEVVCTTHKIYWKQIRLYSKCWRYMARYAHLSDFRVNHWDTVKIWQEIWYTWNTWNSTWIHLHFAIYEVDQARNKLNTGNGYFWAIKMTEIWDMITVNNNDINVYNRKESFNERLLKLSKKQIIVLYKGKYFVNNKWKKLLLNEDNIWQLNV